MVALQRGRWHPHARYDRSDAAHRPFSPEIRLLERARRADHREVRTARAFYDGVRGKRAAVYDYD